MKPEVLAQTKQIEEERRKMIEHAMNPALSNGLNPMNGNIPSNAIPPLPPGAENNITIMMQEEGKAPVPMNMQQIVQLLQNQQNENNRLKTETDTLRHRIGEMEDIIRQLQQLKVNSAQTAQSNTPAFSYSMPSGSGVATSTTRLKSDPEVNIRA
jgi:hypothetical protein